MTRYGLLILLLIAYLSTNVKTDQASNVYSPMEAYWYSKLPSTPMPEIIHNLIHPGQKENFDWTEYPVLWKNVKIPDKPGHPPKGIINMFFQPKDIYPGAKIKEAVSLDRSTVGNAFIPRIEAEALMPFPFKNLSLFLNRYSIEPGSKEAKEIQKSLSHCQAPVPKGVKHFCATSLEAMIDNTILELGTQNLQVLSTILGNKGGKREKIFYRVGSPVVELSGEKFVLCHPMISPQAVYYCHNGHKFKGYAIPLEGNNGRKVNALAICHYDAKEFSRDFLEMLNVKPSTMPICHFLMEDHLVWAPP